MSAASYSAANGSTYSGVTVGGGYDCRLVVTCTALDGDLLVVGCITEVATGDEWLMDLRYPASADLQRAAALLAANPPHDDPDLMVADEDDRWGDLAARWDAALGL